MAMEEMIPASAEGRPAVLKVDGWTYYISVRDAAYMKTLKSWKRAIAAVHPDKGGSAAKFRERHRQRLAWRNKEAQWYAGLGLLPPDGYGAAVVRVNRLRKLKGLSDGQDQRNGVA